MIEAPRLLRCVAPVEGWRIGEIREATDTEAETLVRAGRYEGSMRALDAIHVASAEAVGAVDVFVTYDERQAAAARLAGLRTIAPGV